MRFGKTSETRESWPMIHLLHARNPIICDEGPLNTIFLILSDRVFRANVLYTWVCKSTRNFRKNTHSHRSRPANLTGGRSYSAVFFISAWETPLRRSRWTMKTESAFIDHSALMACEGDFLSSWRHNNVSLCPCCILSCSHRRHLKKNTSLEKEN